MNKFENVDVIASLQAVMKQNTTHYQSDFQYDADLFRAAAKSADSMEKTFLWLSRPDGTYCERERDALLRDTAQHLEWSTYGGASETLLAFAVKIDGMERGKVKGSLYQLDYAAHAGHLKEIALPRHHATLTFEDGAKRTCSLQDYPGHQNAIMARYGKIAAVRYEPADAGQLAALLRAEQEGRETLAPRQDRRPYPGAERGPDSGRGPAHCGRRAKIGGGRNGEGRTRFPLFLFRPDLPRLSGPVHRRGLDPPLYGAALRQT